MDPSAQYRRSFPGVPCQGSPASGCAALNRRSREGFTLVEMVVTLAIVGIMASFAYFKVDSFREQTKLRQAAERIHQTLGWAKLTAEKKGDTMLVNIALPTISVYKDANGNGRYETTDSLLLNEVLFASATTFKPSYAPTEASVASPSSGLADGAGTCGTTVCCTQGAGTTPSWSDGYVNFCARISPSLSPLTEDGAVYLASTKSSVKEVWAIVVNRAKSAEPSLWTADKVPTAASDWRKVR